MLQDQHSFYESKRLSFLIVWRIEGRSRQEKTTQSLLHFQCSRVCHENREWMSVLQRRHESGEIRSNAVVTLALFFRSHNLWLSRFDWVVEGEFRRGTELKRLNIKNYCKAWVNIFYNSNHYTWKIVLSECKIAKFKNSETICLIQSRVCKMRALLFPVMLQV
jgi:hypothetical protein